MFRKNLFLGLTIMLGVVLIYLILQAREEEKEIQARRNEIVRSSKPSRTRVIYPRDLEIIDSSMELTGELSGELSEELSESADSTSEEARSGLVANHRIRIRNRGSVQYQDPLLQIAYLDRREKTLESRTHAATMALSPGATLILDEIALYDIPAETRSCKVRILYSDIAPAISEEAPEESR